MLQYLTEMSERVSEGNKVDVSEEDGNFLEDMILNANPIMEVCFFYTYADDSADGDDIRK